MSYAKLSDVPVSLKEIDNVSLTLEQINHIAEVADTLKASGEDAFAVPLAVKNFQSSHAIQDEKWVAKEDGADDSLVVVRKQDDGRYWITAVSTAALKDREDETFEVQAIDYDIAEANKFKDYPEFRLFHKSFLGIGRVEKMMRVGIFAVDQGASYTDPFSLAACETMLEHNDGTYRCSRGFLAKEVSGYCPNCDEGLIIHHKHMVAGFRCPTCEAMHLQYKGTLTDVHFRKARTFDVTITDVPCVPWTSATASKLTLEDLQMTKKELKEKLLKAGVSEELIDARLKDVSVERLKELDDIPDAVLLKEFEPEKKTDDTEEEPGGDQVFVLDPEVLKDFTNIVKAEVKAALDGFEVEIPDMDIEIKELPALVELKEQVEALTEAVNKLLEKDEKRLKELLSDAPRAGKLRIMRHKGKDTTDEEEDADEEDEEDEEGAKKKKKGKLPPWLAKEMEEKEAVGDVIMGADGRKAKTMTAFLTGGDE